MLPKQYEWLKNEVAPKMLIEALKTYGTIEAPGAADNEQIIEWAQEVGGRVVDLYKADSIPWCGLWMAVIAHRAGKPLPVDPLWALNWGTFGVAVEKPMLGDVITFARKTPDGKRAGHVAMYIGEDFESYHILGGNQSDKVCIMRKKKVDAYAFRRPKYIVQPESVRRIMLSPMGDWSSHEQ